MIDELKCPLGGDETDDCADCAYSCDYHFVDGECVERRATGVNYRTQTCVCQICGKETPFTDEGGHCETYHGWMCNACIKQAIVNGEFLHFEDMEDENSEPDNENH